MIATFGMANLTEILDRALLATTRLVLRNIDAVQRKTRNVIPRFGTSPGWECAYCFNSNIT